MVDETSVRYKAYADFSALARSAQTAKRNIRELKDEEAKLNSQSVVGANKATTANNRRADSLRNLADAAKAQNSVLGQSTVQFIVQAKAAREYADALNAGAKAAQKNAAAGATSARNTTQQASAQQTAAKAVKETAAATDTLATTTRRAYREMMNARNGAQQMGQAVGRAGVQFRGTGQQMGRTLTMADQLNRSFRRLGNWRPRLTPPFIALIPIIAGVLGLINPLVAGLGAAGSAALGFASSLGSVAPAALTVVPALATLLSIVTALKVAFGGIGGAFKAFSQMKKATATGGGGGSTAARAELTQQEEITRAQERYARSIQDTAWAQEDLDEARKEYIKRLRELEKAVNKAAMAEARAAANSQLAKENYANVLADPGSTKGQKMDAAASVDEAQAEYNDIVQENKDNAADLAEMKRKGIEGDREVIRAQRALTDAIYAQRDAQLALTNAQTGADGSGGTAMDAQAASVDAYNEALNKLSPSARRFVETILAMSDAWTELKRNVQERFFSQFVDNVDRLRLLFGPLESMLGNTAEALGRFVDNFLLLITSPEWQSDIILFGEGNVPIIDALGGGVLRLVDAFKDLVIGAQPALQRLVEGFEKGSDRLATFIETARNDGSMAEFLDGSIDRLAQWWRIIKNISKTLFNFGSAASDFAQWLTNGFEETTEGWLESSETALGPNSKFRKYLEDIKPLVSEIKGVFADFFAWFARESADEENIGQMTEMLQRIRDELGPALGRLFDQLADAEIGPKFIDAITRIVEIITILADSPAVEVFFSVLNFLLEVVKWVVANPILGTLLGAIATGFAAIAAVSLVAKFTGITALINLLLTFAKSGKGLPGLLRGIAAAFGIMAPAAGAAAGAGAAGAAGAAAAGTRRGPGGGGLGAGPAVAAPLPGQSRSAYRASQAAGGFVGAARSGSGFNVLSSVAKGAVKGVGIAAIATIAATVIGDLVASGAAEGKEGASQRTGGGLLAGVGTGAGIGALLGNIIPIPGVGAGIGAAVGAVAGGATALATANPEDRAQMFEEIGAWMEGVHTEFHKFLTVFLPDIFGGVVENIGKWWYENVVSPLETIGKSIGDWWYENVVVPWSAGAKVISDWWYNEVVIPMGRLAMTIGEIWDLYVVQPFNRVVLLIQTMWELYVVAPFTAMIAQLQILWQTYVVTPFTNAINTIRTMWELYVVAPFQQAIATIRTMWELYVVQPFQSAIAMIRTMWELYVVQPFQSVITTIRNMWELYVVQPFSAIITAIQTAWQSKVVTPFETVIGGIKSAWDGFWKQFSNFNLIDAVNNALRNFFGLGPQTGGPPGNVRNGGGATLSRVQSVLGAGMGGLRVTSTYRSPSENAAAGGAAGSLHMDRANPAVDLAGPADAMAAVATLLGRIGGWRQLYYNGVNAPGVGFWPGHWDHVHVANTGGRVPGRGNGDTVPAMLTPGEMVIRKEIVNRVGPENMERFNAGLLSYTDLLKQAKNREGGERNVGVKKKQRGGGFGGATMFLNAGGLVPDISFGGPGVPPGGNNGGPAFPKMPPPEGGNITYDIDVYYPEPEPASDGIARTLRGHAYLGGRKP